jgi:hypothetical protein
MSGTGGFRMERFARPGKGKRGGVRVISFYHGKDYPVFLITVFGKGDKDNLTKEERNALAKLAKTIIQSLGPKFGPKREGKK